MKKNLIWFIVLIFFGINTDSKGQNSNTLFSYNIKVNFKNSKIQDGEVFYLKKFLLGDDYVKVDSCIKKNNKLFFNKIIEEPFLGLISMKVNDEIWVSGFIALKDSVVINWVDRNWNDSEVKNLTKIYGGENEFMKQHVNEFRVEDGRLDDINNQINRFGIVLPQSPNFEYWSNFEKSICYWIAQNNDKYYTFFKLFDARSQLSKKTILKCLDFFKNNFRNTSSYIALANYVKTRQENLVGNKFIDVELLDNKQENIKSKNIFLPDKELYVIEFGASWCGYCILQAREINKNYKRIDTTKIQIISISVDSNINAWLNLEKKENYKWKSYIINRKLDNKSIQIIFSSYPTYFVLDRNKKIIGKYDDLKSIPYLKLND